MKVRVRVRVLEVGLGLGVGLGLRFRSSNKFFNGQTFLLSKKCLSAWMHA